MVVADRHVADRLEAGGQLFDRGGVEQLGMADDRGVAVLQQRAQFVRRVILVVGVQDRVVIPRQPGFDRIRQLTADEDAGLAAHSDATGWSASVSSALTIAE